MFSTMYYKVFDVIIYEYVVIYILRYYVYIITVIYDVGIYMK